MLNDLLQFIGAILWNFWTVLAGVMLGFEPVMRWFFPSYDAMATKVIQSQHRRTVARFAAVFAFAAANFLAYRETVEQTRNLQSQTGKDRPTQEQSTAIDRLSGDLVIARGTIDQQTKKIESQQAAIDAQKSELERLKAPKPERHLSEPQRQKLIEVFTPAASQFAIVTIFAPAMDGNAQEYAQDFAKAFRGIQGIAVPDVGMLFPKSNMRPGPDTIILVRDLDHVPPVAEAFAKLMVDAGFQIQGGLFPTLDADKFVLFIAPAQ